MPFLILIEHDENVLRIQSIPPPSCAGKPSRFFRLQKTPTILNMRPPECRGKPISLFHPVFGQFLKDVDSLELQLKQYDWAGNLLDIALRSYDYEEQRQIAFEDQFSSFLEVRPQRVAITGCRLDGIITANALGEKPASIIFEYKNELGVGFTDPTLQGSMGYSKYWAQRNVRFFFFFFFFIKKRNH
jgi:hypothetical protein